MQAPPTLPGWYVPAPTFLNTHTEKNVTQHPPHIPCSPELALSIHHSQFSHFAPFSGLFSPPPHPRALVSPSFFTPFHVLCLIPEWIRFLLFDKSFCPPEESTYIWQKIFDATGIYQAILPLPWWCFWLQHCCHSLGWTEYKKLNSDSGCLWQT